MLQVDQIKWRIECASPDRGPVGYALAELRKYMGRIAGGLDEKGATGVITLGLRKDLPPEAESLLPGPATGFDGYAISIETGENSARVVLGGDNERSVVYAVYDLLERMGCRWFYPVMDERDCEVVPRGADAILKPARFSIASPFRFRWFCWASFRAQTREEIALQMDWAVKCRYNITDYRPETVDDSELRGMMCCSPGHNFGEFLKTEDYFEEHPEWFGMQNGIRVPHAFRGSQFCWSNAEAQDVFVDNVEKYTLANPRVQILGLTGGDGLAACTCPECAKLNPSDWEIQILNKVVERLETSAPWAIIVTAGGYPPVVEPPLVTRPHPKLRAVWAHWGRSHGTPYDNAEYAAQNLEPWRAAFDGRLTAFQYYSDHFAEPWIAAPYASAIVGDRKYLLEGRTDGMVNLCYPAGYWWNWSLNSYLAGLCFYDVSADPFDLIDDYALRYFGKSAGQLMGAYYQEWARNLDLAYGVRGGSGDGERAILADQRKRLIKPALEAAKDDALVSYRIAKAEKLHAAAERLMSIHGAQQRAERLRLAGDLRKAAESAEEAKRLVAETQAYIQSLIDLNQGLLDPELLSFFYPGLKNAVEQEAKAVAEGATEKRETEKKEISAEDMVPEH